jgi:hypothetical protein
MFFSIQENNALTQTKKDSLQKRQQQRQTKQDPLQTRRVVFNGNKQPHHNRTKLPKREKLNMPFFFSNNATSNETLISNSSETIVADISAVENITAIVDNVTNMTTPNNKTNIMSFSDSIKLALNDLGPTSTSAANERQNAIQYGLLNNYKISAPSDGHRRRRRMRRPVAPFSSIPFKRSFRMHRVPLHQVCYP